MDDMLLQARSIEECTLHCHIVIIVFMSLGWSFKWAKCDLVPKQHFTHLGFDFDTVKMTISCQSVKVIKLRNFCVEIYSKGKITVHNLEKMLGFMESLRPAVPLAALHYRSLQKQLLVAKKGIRIPRKIVFLSQKSLAELKWWKSPSGFVAQCSAPIREPEPTVNIWSDANLTMGGAHCSRGTFYQRPWSQKELQLQPHINLLEIRAAREGLSLARPRDIVRINLDSRTASAYIKKQGGTRSSVLNHEACLLWKEAVSRKLTLVTPLWLSTKDNAMADFLSRHQLVQWEFLLSDDVFQLVLDNFHISPTLDVFASRDTKKLTRYMSWFPDPEAVARDALLHPWDQESYAFPPVPLILKSLQKIEREKIRVVMILPKWPSAIWWTHVQRLQLQDCPDNGGQVQEPPLSGPIGGRSPSEQDLNSFLSNHLASGTHKGYNSCYRKFKSYCLAKNLNPTNCNPEDIARYIQHLFVSGSSYSSVNLARSAISKYHIGFNGTPAGQHKVVCNAVKAVFRLRPPLPKYKSTYDVSIVLEYLKSLPANPQLSMKMLTYKTLFLLTVATISRVSSISKLGPTLSVHQVSLYD